MTFSEHDLLPYKKIKFERTPENLKTIFMQWTMLETPILENSGFVTDIHPDTLASMAILDMGADSGGSDEFFSAPQDFTAIFEHTVVNGSDPDAQRRVTRQAELRPMVLGLFQPHMATVKVQVEKLIDEELESTTMPKEKWMKANLRSKAFILADFRVKEKFTVPKPKDYDMNLPQYEFCIRLNRLIGGGDTMSVTKLYFPYTTPFHRFEKTLQEETKLCVIPSDTSERLNSSEPVNSSVPASTPDASSPLVSTPSAPASAAAIGPASSTYTAYGRKWETYEEYGTTWVQAPLPPSRKETGYTVKDGPWRCRIVSTKDTQEEIYHISDEISYRVLVLNVQAHNKKYPDHEHSVVIMHSKERAIWEKLREQKRQDKNDARQRSRSSVGTDEDEQLFGETYFEWLCRTKPRG